MTHGEFPETRWTLIRRARVRDAASLEEWCRGYWRPVRDYIRAQGRSDDEADELCQRFFEKIMVRGPDRALPDSLDGVFRAYLKRAVKNFLHDEWKAGRRQKRGGGTETLELREEILPEERGGPGDAFEKAYVLTLLERAMTRLSREMAEVGKEDFFHAVAPLLDGTDAPDRAALADRLGLSVGAFRVALHRTRQRFRSLIEDEVRQTVASESEFEEEIRYLLTIWS